MPLGITRASRAASRTPSTTVVLTPTTVRLARATARPSGPSNEQSCFIHTTGAPTPGGDASTAVSAALTPLACTTPAPLDAISRARRGTPFSTPDLPPAGTSQTRWPAAAKRST